MTDYKLINNDTLCVNNIKNCETYLDSSTTNADGDKIYKCTKCVMKHYLDVTANNNLGECLKGNVENCEIYHQIKDECVECSFGYYKTDSVTCTASTPTNISNFCSKTDSNKPDTCLECKQNFVLINRESSCEFSDKYKEIGSPTESNCTKWLDNVRCVDCRPMFYGTTCEFETG